MPRTTDWAFLDLDRGRPRRIPEDIRSASDRGRLALGRMVDRAGGQRCPAKLEA